MQGEQIVFVIECCENCKAHAWNTRHDEAKYIEFFKRTAAAIIDRIPNAIVMKNQIPKNYLHFDLYNNLIQNDDETCPYFAQVPRIGAFEVSYKGMLIFSKLRGGYWPNTELVADKCAAVVSEESQGKDCTMYLAGNTPVKGGGYIPSMAKSRESRKGASPGRKSGMKANQAGFQQQQQPQPTAFNDMPDQSLRANEVNPPMQMNETKFSVSQGASQSPREDVKVGPHLRDPGDLSGFPLFPPGTKSLLCQLLSRDIWKKYEFAKDKCNFTFKEAIFSGCQNTDSGIGIYAGCHDSYYQFPDMFDKIIDTYHGHKKTDKHIAENPAVKLNAPDFPADEAAMIVSTRIRVGRNLEGYPLGPGIYTPQQRAEIEGYVLEALKSFDGELKGKYYGLGTMTAAEQKQLIADHFLFKEGDRFLQACGVNRNWPDNRGIYHNDAKTFLVWVNEEDQLRVISMQKGSNIRQVFERLMLALSKFEKVAKFAYDDHLGYITSCPTNLGTAMRASVHIKLPLLGKKKDEFQAIADKYHVQIRGAHGEHTETDDGIFDISNKRRLGMSMTMLVQDMYDGVKAMIKREKELMGGAAPAKQAAAPAKQAVPPQQSAPATSGSVKAGPHLKKPEDITGFPEFPAGTKSLLCKYLKKDVYDKYKGKKDSCGVSFEQMILSGTQNVDSGIGIYAGCHKSYYEFGPDLFDEIIKDYHGHGTKDKHVSNMNYKELKCPPFTKEEAARIISTRIRVGRNLADVPLGPGITKEQRNKVEATVSGVLSKFTGELGGKYYALKTMTKQDQEKLINDHFLFKEGDRFLDACGLNRDWPDGRGIYHNDAKTFLVWINEEDQLRIISMQQGADILAVFTRLATAANEIEKVAKFAHDEHLGYITSCPTNLGTALRASVHIKLPLLGKDKKKFNEIADKYYVQIRGIHGEHTETDDGIFDISNKRRLGRSEKDLVQDMYDGVKAMITAEQELEAKSGAKPAAPKEVPAQAPKDAPAAAAGGKVKAGPHLKSIKDLSGMVEFPAGTKSSVARFMTEPVYNEYKGKKDKAGVPFELMVLSGCQNVDSGIGVYAGSHDSYTTFNKLFDAVIEDYHKHGVKDKHVSNMNYKELNCPPFSEVEKGMIISTRIRVGRNLADYPLGPGITKEQRNEVEQKVSGVLSKFTGELGGKYYSLKTMSKEDQQQLIDDHFLFKEGDRFLDACGLNRDWPDGRGIFHNDAKTFLVWINEEDQLRIISMQKGADILAVFTRLATAAAEIEKVAKFAHDDHLGYITSCPTNLGTALRASVHIKLPLLGKDKKKFNEIADKYYVQIRGIHGEHTETDDGIFDISNKRRLGRSEKDLVQDMYSGVKEMMKVEMELAKAAGVVMAGSHLKKIDDLTGPIQFPASCKSLLCKYLTPEIFNKYKDAKDKSGVPFKLMVLSGAQNVDSGIGLYAGSHDSYTTFAELFDKVIEDYHTHKKTDKHVSDMDHTKLKCPPFPQDEAAMIVSTRIRVGRNMAGYPLGPGVTKEQRLEIMKKVTEACDKFEGELKGKFYPLEGMKAEDQKKLIEDHFLFKEGDRFLDACGLNRDWPSGRGIFHNDAKSFLVWVNEEDQLRIISMQKGADIGAVFTRLATAADLIEKVAKFAHDDHLGYITSCPTNLGTALRASVHIKLPCLAKNKDQFNQIADKYYVQIRGIHGEHTETDDGVFDISNKRRLGRSERELVQDMYDGVKAMIAAEKALAAKTAKK